VQRHSRLRPSGFDDLGLRRALGDRMLPLLVAAMAFLAALALAGAVGAAGLAQHWQEGAAAALTVQVPSPTAPALADGAPITSSALADGAPKTSSALADGTPKPSRLDQTVAVLRDTPGIATARPLTSAELTALLRPWLGEGAGTLSLPLPAVIEVHLKGAGPDLDALSARLQDSAPGALVESHGVWVGRLSALARSLQAVASLALVVVACVAGAVVMVATRAGLSARREAIGIVHGLGATDGYIAGRFAGRATLLAAAGGAVGAVLALPLLLAMARLAAPFASMPPAPGAAPPMLLLGALPPVLWLALPGLPLAAGAIGFATAQATVRSWLRRLP
jgi:cell division transport system permease protein